MGCLESGVGIINKVPAIPLGQAIEKDTPDLRVQHGTALFQKPQLFFPDPLEDGTELVIRSA